MPHSKDLYVLSIATLFKGIRYPRKKINADSKGSGKQFLFFLLLHKLAESRGQINVMIFNQEGGRVHTTL